MLIKTSEATPLQINYLVAKCEKHESRCPWILEQQGYAAWQSYERAWVVLHQTTQPIGH